MRLEVWKNEKCHGNTSRQASVSTLFSSLVIFFFPPFPFLSNNQRDNNNFSALLSSRRNLTQLMILLAISAHINFLWDIKNANDWKHLIDSLLHTYNVCM